MLLPTHISSFARKDHMNQLIEPQPHEISSLDIHQFLSAHPDLINQLLPHATLSNIVHIARSNPQGFTAYCTISNTVKAIGIGGTASIYFSAKVTPFLTQSREAMARNIVAFTRSEGLCVLLLPTTLEVPLLILLASQPSSHFPTLLSTLNLAYLIRALGFSPTRLVILARGTFSHSPCNSLMKGKLTFLPYVYALIFRSQIIGNCQQGISIGMNSAMGNPLLSCSWFLAMAAFISLLAIIIWLLLFSLNETVLPSP